MNSNSNTNVLNIAVEDDVDDEDEVVPTGGNTPSGNFAAPSYSDLQVSTAKQLASFNDLLETLASTEDKQKALWRQIYENAVTDRMNAYIVWLDLYKDVEGKSSEHAIHGQNLSRYMERMSKANDQLLKLVELVAAAKKKDSSEVTEDSLYTEMERSSKTTK